MYYNTAQYFMSYVPKGSGISVDCKTEDFHLELSCNPLGWQRDHCHQYPWQYGGELMTCRFLLESNQLHVDQCCMAQVSVDTP